MEISKKAAESILAVMKETGLSPDKFYLRFDEVNGGLGFTFTTEDVGKEYRFHGLKIVVTSGVNTNNLKIDYREEVNGKKGLIFLGG